MIEYSKYTENNLYSYDKEMNIFKLYSDEFEKLLLFHGLELDVLETKDGDINFSILNCDDISRIDCKKFEKILKKEIPYIQDILINESVCATLTINADRVEII